MPQLLMFRHNRQYTAILGGGVIPYLVYTRMCGWTGYGFWPLCPEEGIYSNFMIVCPEQGMFGPITFIMAYV